MTTFYLGCSAIALYFIAFVYQITKVRQNRPLRRDFLLGLASIAILVHFFTSFRLVVTEQGFDFSLWQASSLILTVVNLLIWVSSLRKPAHNLFLFLFPLTIPVIITSLNSDSMIVTYRDMNLETGLHVLSSILAYSLLTIAALQAMLLAYQNWQLRHKHLKGWIRALPPLQTMEALLFEVLWAGFALLTVSLISGFWLFEDLFAQHLGHKTAFSLAAWVVYAVLLWGRHQLGWRGNTAIRWTLAGFIATALAYWGSKFVYEVLLTSPQ